MIFNIDTVRHELIRNLKYFITLNQNDFVFTLRLFCVIKNARLLHKQLNELASIETIPEAITGGVHLL